MIKEETICNRCRSTIQRDLDGKLEIGARALRLMDPQEYADFLSGRAQHYRQDDIHLCEKCAEVVENCIWLRWVAK